MARRALGQIRRLEHKWRSLRETALESRDISNYNDLEDFEIDEEACIVTTIVTAVATLPRKRYGLELARWVDSVFNVLGQHLSTPPRPERTYPLNREKRLSREVPAFCGGRRWGHSIGREVLGLLMSDDLVASSVDRQMQMCATGRESLPTLPGGALG